MFHIYDKKFDASLSAIRWEIENNIFYGQRTLLGEKNVIFEQSAHIGLMECTVFSLQ